MFSGEKMSVFPRTQRTVSSLLSLAMLAVVALAVISMARTAPAAAAVSCTAFSTKLNERVNPTTTTAVLTTATSLTNYTSAGFTQARDLSMMVASKTGTGLSPVYRLYLSSTKNYFYTANATEAAKAVSGGYKNEGIAFYASTTSATCLTPVSSFHKPGKHRFAIDSTEAAYLQATGWKREMVRFYVGKLAAASCTAFTGKLQERIDPVRQTQFLTAGSPSVPAAFTLTRSVTMESAPAAGAGLHPVYRLYRSSTGGYLYTMDTAEVASAVRSGFVNQGIGFYGSKVKGTCLQPVFSYTKAYKHQFIAHPAEGAALVAQGWKKEVLRFYVKKPAVDTKFSFAVLPDTQNEVMSASDTRFVNRTDWMVANRAKFDIRFSMSGGDVVSWDTPEHEQYVRAAAALKKLENAGMSYSLAVGNHDTAAVCPGGSACPGESAAVNLRNTKTFNQYLSRGTGMMEGQFEAGKVDNSYHTFIAGDVAWLVLNLELWPRQQAIDWAKTVVKTHPKHNVIIATHGYLKGTGAIDQTNGGYGSTTSQHLFDTLIKPNANVRMVICGHAGSHYWRIDKGSAGNRIDTFQTTFHSNTTNPVRIIEVDTSSTPTLTSRIYSPYTTTTATTTSPATGSAATSWVR